MKLRNMKSKLRRRISFFKSIRATPDEASISGYFIFEEWREAITRKFQSNFKGALKNFKLKPKDLRIASILKRRSKSKLNESEAESELKEWNANKKQRMSSDKNQNSKEESKESDFD